MNLNEIKKMKKTNTTPFPSPLGELWIWIREYLNNVDSIKVSVPARGIMNLNPNRENQSVWSKKRFRPRSGNYESEYLHGRVVNLADSFVSVPARGIMNLNNDLLWYTSLKVVFPSPLGELWIWMVVHVIYTDAQLVSVPARGIMNLNQ